MLFIYGAPASKQSTVGREVAAQTRFALFQSPHRRRSTGRLRFGSPEFVRLREQFRIETARAAVHINRSLVFTFCPELSVNPTLPLPAQAMVEQAGRGRFVHSAGRRRGRAGAAVTQPARSVRETAPSLGPSVVQEQIQCSDGGDVDTGSGDRHHYRQAQQWWQIAL